MMPFLVVFVTAAVVTAAVTPLMGRVAWRLGAVAWPGPRKVHRRPVPQLGGLAMLVGFLAALGVARLLPPFREVFATTSEPLGILLGVLLIAAVGVYDDARGLSPPVKVAGQILAALAPVLFGVQLVYAFVPGVDIVALAPDLGFPLTILAIVVMINAVNLIDGLDGLAAGVVGIAAVAFFLFASTSEARGIAEAVPSAAPLVASAVAGMCAGFLVHNFHPARIFMGDTGAMMLGLLLASAGVSYVGRTTAPGYGDFAGSIPLLIPVLVLAIPFLDTVFAVARRLYRKQPITAPDKSHLHHLLIAFGYSHPRAVLTLYYWSAVLAFATIGAALIPLRVFAWVLAAAVLAGVVVTAAGLRRPQAQTSEAPAIGVQRKSG